MNVPPEDRLVEKVAVALFDFDERRDKLVRCGLVEPRAWPALPEGCGVHVLYRDKARAALSALEGRPDQDEGKGTSGPGDCGPSTVDALRPRLQNLTRYDMGIDRGCGWADTKLCTVDVEQWDDGEWVRYADVLTALEPKATGTVAGAEGGGHNPDLTAAGGQEDG